MFVTLKGVYLNAEIVHSYAIWKSNTTTKVYLEILLGFANGYDITIRV